jgi:flavin reductase (DIM6/NTAB) family NADH-FMN oxidoreductase RutF
LKTTSLPLEIDPRIFRDTLGHYASGVTVVTGVAEGAPVGFTCQSFYSVSTEPPLVSISVMNTSTSYPRIRPSGRFAVNILAHDQHEISSRFARSGTDKWAGLERGATSSGNPLISGALMWLDCSVYAEHEAGDHTIVLGRVEEMSPIDRETGEPLIFFKGRYRRLTDAAAGA